MNKATESKRYNQHLLQCQSILTKMKLLMGFDEIPNDLYKNARRKPSFTDLGTIKSRLLELRISSSCTKIKDNKIQELKKPQLKNEISKNLLASKKICDIKNSNILMKYNEKISKLEKKSDTSLKMNELTASNQNKIDTKQSYSKIKFKVKKRKSKNMIVHKNTKNEKKLSNTVFKLHNNSFWLKFDEDENELLNDSVDSLITQNLGINSENSIRVKDVIKNRITNNAVNREILEMKMDNASKNIPKKERKFGNRNISKKSKFSLPKSMELLNKHETKPDSNFYNKDNLPYTASFMSLALTSNDLKNIEVKIKKVSHNNLFSLDDKYKILKSVLLKENLQADNSNTCLSPLFWSKNLNSEKIFKNTTTFFTNKHEDQNLYTQQSFFAVHSQVFYNKDKQSSDDANVSYRDIAVNTSFLDYKQRNTKSADEGQSTQPVDSKINQDSANKSSKGSTSKSSGQSNISPKVTHHTLDIYKPSLTSLPYDEEDSSKKKLKEKEKKHKKHSRNCGTSQRNSPEEKKSCKFCTFAKIKNIECKQNDYIKNIQKVCQNEVDKLKIDNDAVSTCTICRNDMLTKALKRKPDHSVLVNLKFGTCKCCLAKNLKESSTQSVDQMKETEDTADMKETDSDIKQIDSTMKQVEEKRSEFDLQVKELNLERNQESIISETASKLNKIETGSNIKQDSTVPITESEKETDVNIHQGSIISKTESSKESKEKKNESELGEKESDLNKNINQGSIVSKTESAKKNEEKKRKFEDDLFSESKLENHSKELTSNKSLNDSLKNREEYLKSFEKQMVDKIEELKKKSFHSRNQSITDNETESMRLNEKRREIERQVIEEYIIEFLEKKLSEISEEKFQKTTTYNTTIESPKRSREENILSSLVKLESEIKALSVSYNVNNVQVISPHRKCREDTSICISDCIKEIKVSTHDENVDEDKIVNLCELDCTPSQNCRAVNKGDILINIINEIEIEGPESSLKNREHMAQKGEAVKDSFLSNRTDTNKEDESENIKGYVKEILLELIKCLELCPEDNNTCQDCCPKSLSTTQDGYICYEKRMAKERLLNKTNNTDSIRFLQEPIRKVANTNNMGVNTDQIPLYIEKIVYKDVPVRDLQDWTLVYIKLGENGIQLEDVNAIHGEHNAKPKEDHVNVTEVTQVQESTTPVEAALSPLSDSIREEQHDTKHKEDDVKVTEVQKSTTPVESPLSLLSVSIKDVKHDEEHKEDKLNVSFEESGMSSSSLSIKDEKLDAKQKKEEEKKKKEEEKKKKEDEEKQRKEEEKQKKEEEKKRKEEEKKKQKSSVVSDKSSWDD